MLPKYVLVILAVEFQKSDVNSIVNITEITVAAEVEYIFATMAVKFDNQETS